MNGLKNRKMHATTHPIARPQRHDTARRWGLSFLGIFRGVPLILLLSPCVWKMHRQRFGAAVIVTMLVAIGVSECNSDDAKKVGTL